MSANNGTRRQTGPFGGMVNFMGGKILDRRVHCFFSSSSYRNARECQDARLRFARECLEDFFFRCGIWRVSIGVLSMVVGK